MRKFSLALFLLACLFSAAHAEEEWFPYYFPANPAEAPDYLGAPASAFNAGKAVLDAPAGKRGFVMSRDGHFFFEDGTRARFWGTNLCFGANFPDRKQAKIMADRMAYFGFNAVRLHHMDMYFEPEGIFEDVAPAYKSPQKKPTGKLSAKQLDRLDYLIAQLKERGIYVNINLLVSRHFTEADGVLDAEKLDMAAKPYSIFDSRLILLQKKYAKDLLSHYNPYTKLRYAEDPAVCMIEINNENTIFELNRDAMPDYYKKEFYGLYEKWLAGKNKSEWTIDRKEFLAEMERKYLIEMRDYLRRDLGVKAPIGIGAHSHPGQLALQRECLDYVDKHAYYDHPRFPNKMWDRMDFIIYNKSIFEDKNLGLIEKIKKARDPAKPFTASEWNHCYPNEFTYETPALLASEARKGDWDALFQFAWAHHPADLDNYDNIDSYFNANSNAQQLMLCSFGSRIFLGDGNFPDVPVGEIKNTDSGWNSEGKFDWGRGPTLMKKPAPR